MSTLYKHCWDQFSCSLKSHSSYSKKIYINVVSVLFWMRAVVKAFSSRIMLCLEQSYDNLFFPLIILPKQVFDKTCEAHALGTVNSIQCTLVHGTLVSWDLGKFKSGTICPPNWPATVLLYTHMSLFVVFVGDKWCTHYDWTNLQYSTVQISCLAVSVNLYRRTWK